MFPWKARMYKPHRVLKGSNGISQLRERSVVGFKLSPLDNDTSECNQTQHTGTKYRLIPIKYLFIKKCLKGPVCKI